MDAFGSAGMLVSGAVRGTGATSTSIRTPSTSSGNLGIALLDDMPKLSIRHSQRAVLEDMLRACVALGDDDDIPSFQPQARGSSWNASAATAANTLAPLDASNGLHGRGAATKSSALAADDPAQIWKVLVYDAAARDIIAPLLRVADLRANGVTLHLMLTAARQSIPDVPAVYFVAPTVDNVKRIAADAQHGLYNTLWINFTSPVPRTHLESLADALASSQIPSPHQSIPLQTIPGTIARVYDTYSEFLALEDDLFNLNLPDAFAVLSARNASDAQVQSTIQQIVERLFCVIVTLGTVPVIQAQRSGPAEMVAVLLEKRIREALVSGNNLFSEISKTTGSFTPATQRPLLVLFDRTLDLPVMLHHTWTYQALAHDSLSLRLNRVSVRVQDATNTMETEKKRTFDLDKSDEFWARNAGLPFPMVAEAVESALQQYKVDVEALNRSAKAVGSDGDVNAPLLNISKSVREKQKVDSTGDLAAAILTLPQLTKRKQLIDIHTNIATALLECIKERGLDGFYQVEEELLARPQSFDVERILALLHDPRGSPSDKLRLFLVYYLCVEGVSVQQLNRCVSALNQCGCKDMRAYEYLKSIKAFTSSMATVTGNEQMASNSGINSSYAAVLGTLSQVASNVQNLILSTDKACPAARVISSLMNQKGDAEILDGYVTFDPRSPKSGAVSSTTKRSFSEAVAFVVGPGNYIEFQNCKDHVCSNSKMEGNTKRMVLNGKSLIYGATDLCNGTEFLEQLNMLGGKEARESSE